MTDDCPFNDQDPVRLSGPEGTQVQEWFDDRGIGAFRVVYYNPDDNEVGVGGTYLNEVGEHEEVLISAFEWDVIRLDCADG